MIHDSLLVLAGSVDSSSAITGQTLAQVAGNYLSTNTIDLQTTGRDLGKGEPINIACEVTEAFTSGGSATVQIQFVQASTAALDTNLEVLRETTTMAIADLTLGKIIHLQWPRVEPKTSRRYIGLRFVIGTATTTAGKIFAAVTANADDAKVYITSGFTVN